jgi:hypothetical protein
VCPELLYLDNATLRRSCGTAGRKFPYWGRIAIRPHSTDLKSGSRWQVFYKAAECVMDVGETAICTKFMCTRAPAEGLWRRASNKLDRDDIVVFEVARRL